VDKLSAIFSARQKSELYELQKPAEQSAGFIFFEISAPKIATFVRGVIAGYFPVQ
jgi:hypothetical protein